MKYSKQTSKIGDPDGGNYQNVDSKGQTRLYGDATQWDDLKFPATTLRQGATTKPDFDPVDVGLLFPQNDSGEIVYIIAQMPHEWKLETDIHPHIHYVQDFDHTVTTPAFKMDYRWYKNGEDPTGSFTTITANTFVFPYTSGSILQIVSFPAIDATGIDAVNKPSANASAIIELPPNPLACIAALVASAAPLKNAGNGVPCANDV